MKTHNKAFGEALRAFRKESGHTQETLAFECGLDRTYISVLELGTSSPSLNTMIALCPALGITLTQFAARIDAILAAGTS